MNGKTKKKPKISLKKYLKELKHLHGELVALQRASGNAMAIDQRNRELQAAVVTLEQENLSLKHKNTRLEESINQKQLYTGGFLVFAGFVLHWLSGLFRLGTGRRSSYDDL
mgnify:CR=1 FL=1